MKGEKSMNVNIRDIYNRTANMSGSRAGVLNGSMLAIGSKGQVVEGVVSKVSNQISINFNGVEVAVPKTAVQNAREGETRRFIQLVQLYHFKYCQKRRNHFRP